jgi:mRNA interferase MazF
VSRFPPHCPDRGDIIWLDFDPRAGHEQAGRRPALVLTPRLYNQRTGLCLVCPVTSQQKGYPFEVPLPLDSRVSGAILADHIKSVDWSARHATMITRAEDRVVAAVLRRVRALLAGSP